ncbi:MAG: tyrosine-type recombinase/integrase [Phycisphaerae bacterium]|nr:tyrosine-type recombinase/integrase [Phycisphaerae bacterium]
MPNRTAPRIPFYRLHKTSGRAVVRLNGRDIYLGKHGTPESHANYNRVISEWTSNFRQLPSNGVRPNAPALTICEIALPYLAFVEQHYRKHGRPTSEVFSIKRALEPLIELYGRTEARNFGPLALKTYRDELIAADLSRGVINNHVSRIKRFFKWATANEMVPSDVHHGLQCVVGLRCGRSPARETQPIRPVDDAIVDATIEHVSFQVATMIQLQRYTGMRPCEVIIMRGCDLDMSGKVWAYEPDSHKTEHHGRHRVIYLGPRAQKVLGPALKSDVNAYLFSPREVMLRLRHRLRMNRKTPMTPSQRKRRPKKDPKKAPGDHYMTSSYEHAIHRGCDKAFPPPEGTTEEERRQWRKAHRWTPNQLRHNAATFLRKEFGIEAARVVLGHASSAVTEIYAELDLTKAADIMARVG